MRWKRAILLPLLLLAACSPGTADSASPPTAPAGERHAESGLRIVPVTVTTTTGRHVFRAEVAASQTEQARGLMFRTALGPDDAMIFPMNPPRDAVFWMKNTVIPLDILFIGVDGRINNIAAMTEPYSLDPRASAGVVKAVLELAGGRAAQLGIAPGDMVEW